MPRIAVSVLLAAAIAAAPAAVRAGKPEDVFAGKVLTSRTRYPTAARSPAAYIKQLRKQSTENFIEDKEKKSWKIYFAAFFRAPLNDIEVTINLYDVTDGSRQFVDSFEQYLEDRGQRVIISNLTIDRERFGVNRRLLMTIENRKRILAQGKFKILGQGEHYTGKVEFTEEEANKPDE